MDTLRQFAKQLTEKPGVYRMLDAKGNIVYVGKAKSLRARVCSYFLNHDISSKTRVLMGVVDKIDVTVTATENEALILEANLIKQHAPKYNVLMRDDKSYPYLRLNSEHDFPRLDIYRGSVEPTEECFGPYPNVNAVRQSLNLLQKLFKVRQCSDIFFQQRKRPCLQYQINRCTAPCVGLVSKEDYAMQVQQVRLFLSGKSEAVAKKLQSHMQSYARNKEYEKAAEARDQLAQVRELTQSQRVEGKREDVDIFVAHQQGGELVIVVMMVRFGQVLGHRSFFPRSPTFITLKDALTEFIPQYYINPVHQHAGLTRVVVSLPVDEREWLQSALQKILSPAVQLTVGRHAHYQAWCDLAYTNAVTELQQVVHQQSRFTDNLASLQSALSLPHELSRIECFDISHTSGNLTVASCVVCTRNGMQKSLYRSFNIKGVTPGDDYEAMKQALLRRYTKLKKSEGIMPDMIIIDGGKGQLKQAVGVMEELQLPGVLLLAIAKGASRKPGHETLFLHGYARQFHLAHDSPGLHCLQLIRDEAHRFAVVSHRKRRAKQATRSVLETLPGVGAKRRQALLLHFGVLQALEKASVEDITKVDGISKRLATLIYEHFHPSS